MEEKQYNTARNNEQSPAPGMAAVNTHNPTEESTASGERDLKEGEAAFDAEDAKRQRDEANPGDGHRQPTHTGEQA